MTTEERLLRLENALTTISELVAQETSRTDTLLQLVRDHDERLVTQTEWINRLGASLERVAQTLARMDERLSDLEAS